MPWWRFRTGRIVTERRLAPRRGSRSRPPTRSVTATFTGGVDTRVGAENLQQSVGNRATRSMFQTSLAAGTTQVLRSVETWDPNKKQFVDAGAEKGGYSSKNKAGKDEDKRFFVGITGKPSVDLMAASKSLDQLRKLDPADAARIDPKSDVPRNILQVVCGESWNVAKREFADTPTEKTIMRKLWEFRQWHHEKILKLTQEEVNKASADGLTKWIAAGSATLTSDIDVNLKGERTEEAVAEFNRQFRLDGWNVEAGVAYDVNVYAMDFMHGMGSAGDNGALLVSQEGKRTGKDAGGISSEDLRLVDVADQEVWALLKTRIYMTGDEWTAYKEYVHYSHGVIESVEKRYEEYFLNLSQRMSKVAAEAGVVETAADAVISTGKSQTGNQLLAGQAKSLSAKKGGQSAAGKQGFEENLMIKASNQIYEEKLKAVARGRSELGAYVEQFNALKATTGADEIEMASAERALDGKLTGLRMLIAECSLYSNEAYLTHGGVNHAVVGLQQGKKITLAEGHTLNAVQENYADALKEIGRHGETLGEAAYKAGKYIWRMCDAAKNMGIGFDEVLDLHHFGFQVTNLIKGASGNPEDDSLELAKSLLGIEDGGSSGVAALREQLNMVMRLIASDFHKNSDHFDPLGASTPVGTYSS